MGTPTFTQTQIDALAAKYAEGVVSGSITIEGRSRSFSYGSLDAMWNAIQKMQKSVDAVSGTGRGRSTYMVYNRG